MEKDRESAKIFKGFYLKLQKTFFIIINVLALSSDEC